MKTQFLNNVFSCKIYNLYQYFKTESVYDIKFE